MGLQHGAGVFLSDEIWNSHTDEQARQHADGVIATMLANKVPWVAQQINDPAGQAAIRYLKDAAQRRGYGSVGSWAQGLPAQTELDRAAQWGAQFHIANVEAPAEDQAWRLQDLDRARVMFPAGMFGVIFTEGAWGRDPAKAKRWVERGAVAIPEAIQSENPNATVLAMLDLANTLGFPAGMVAPCVYLTRAYPASSYSREITFTAGRWSVFRYGDIDAADWDAIRSWPRVTVPSPDPEPAPVNPYAELDRLVGLFRAGSPNIAKAFDEVRRLLVEQQNELAAVRAKLAAAAEALG